MTSEGQQSEQQHGGGGRTNRTRRRSTFVVATSVRNGELSRTTDLVRASDDEKDLIASRLFHKRVFGLLVLQYSCILVISSPFALLESIQDTLEENPTLHTILECIAIGGIVGSLSMAVLYGSKYPVTQICLVSITFSVALEMGLSFANGSLGLAGYVAVGQATTSFALILALLQFDLDWLSYQSAYIFSFGAALLWSVVLMEQGYSTLTSFGIGIGGFGFVAMVLFCSYTVEQHVTPEEYVLATLFILCPEALLCIGANDRHVEEDGEGQGTISETTPLVY